MPQFRFNTVFAGMLILSILTSFIISPDYTEKLSGIRSLFIPVAWFSGQTAAYVSGRVKPAVSNDTRSDATLREENQRLKTSIAYLQTQLDELARRAGERKQLGTLLEYCVSSAVVGGDASNRGSLLIEQATPAAIEDRQPVVYANGLVGRIERANKSSAQVRLITDKGSRPVGVSFARLIKKPDGLYALQRLPVTKVVLSGNGSNQLLARQAITKRDLQAADLKPGDWALIDDVEFPRLLAGFPVAQVTEMRESVTNAMYVDIFLEPMTNLSQLRDVMVMTKR